MIIEGVRIGNEYYVLGHLINSELNISYKPILFLVDTGCTITTLSLSTAIRFEIFYISSNVLGLLIEGGREMEVGINNNNLSFVGQTRTANGMLNTYANNNISSISFSLPSSLHNEYINTINVSKPSLNTNNYNSIMEIPSLLGMDILQRYKIYYDKNHVYLEK
jgi:hypothetical protein